MNVPQSIFSSDSIPQTHGQLLQEREARNGWERAALACQQGDAIRFRAALQEPALAEHKGDMLNHVSGWVILTADPHARAITGRNVAFVEDLGGARDAVARSALVQELLELGQQLAGPQAQDHAFGEALALVWTSATAGAIEGQPDGFLELCSAPLAVELLMSPVWRDCAWNLGAKSCVQVVEQAVERLKERHSLQAEELLQMAFIGACAMDQRDAAHAFLEQGADLNVALTGRQARGARPGNALEQAIAHGQFPMAQELVSMGAKTRTPASATEALMSHCTATSDRLHGEQALEILLRSGARFDDNALSELSIKALRAGEMDQALFLFEQIDEVTKAQRADTFWLAATEQANPNAVGTGQWGVLVQSLLDHGLPAISARALGHWHAEIKDSRDFALVNSRARAIEELARRCDASTDSALLAFAETQELTRRTWKGRDEVKTGKPNGNRPTEARPARVGRPRR